MHKKSSKKNTQQEYLNENFLYIQKCKQPFSIFISIYTMCVGGFFCRLCDYFLWDLEWVLQNMKKQLKYTKKLLKWKLSRKSYWKTTALIQSLCILYDMDVFGYGGELSWVELFLWNIIKFDRKKVLKIYSEKPLQKFES